MRLLLLLLVFSTPLAMAHGNEHSGAASSAAGNPGKPLPVGTRQLAAAPPAQAEAKTSDTPVYCVRNSAGVMRCLQMPGGARH